MVNLYKCVMLIYYVCIECLGNSDGEDNGEEETYYDDLYCVACDRIFKNEKT